MEKKLTSSDFFWAFIRSNFLQGSWNMERMQALGYAFGMVPILRRLYEGEELKKAMKRHLEFYNTQPFVTAPIIGITAGLEEKRANGADIADGVINGIKVGMMGPLAGVGDPIFWGTLRPITAALGVIGLVLAIVYIQLNPKYAAVAAAPAASSGSSDADDDLDDELD